MEMYQLFHFSFSISTVSSLLFCIKNKLLLIIFFIVNFSLEKELKEILANIGKSAY